MPWKPFKPSKPYRRLKWRERERAMEGYLNGEKLEDLAAELNTSPAAISMAAKRIDLPRRHLGWKG